ncbi:MAG TPA: hypothetical protein VGR25_11905 [bacterium]|jgi:hypothetical protein|nr:hypothetical protein [bacterium]
MRTLIIMILLVLVVSPLTRAQEGLSKEQIIDGVRQKVQTTTPPPEVKRIETVAQFTLRVRGRETCSFQGTVIQEGARQELRTADLPPECAQFREQIRTIFLSSSQAATAFIDDNTYELVGERVVNGDRQYQIRARARDPQKNLSMLEFWVSWDTGLIRDGLMHIRKPKIDPIHIVQAHYQEDGRWLVKSVHARTSFYILFIFRIGVEIDLDVKSHRFFF